MDHSIKADYIHSFLKPKRWTGEETRTLLNSLAMRKNFEAPTAQIYYTQLLKDTNLKTSWNILYRKVRNLKSSFRKAEEWSTTAEAQVLKEKGKDGMKAFNLELRSRCRYYYKLKDIFGGTGMVFYKKRKSKEFRRSSRLKLMQSPPMSYELTNDSYIPDNELTYSDQQTSASTRQETFQENGQETFSELSELLSRIKNYGNDPDMIEYEFEAQKHENEIEFRKMKQKIEFEIRKQELQIQRMELEKNEKIRILDIKKDELIARYKLELKYSLNKDEKSSFST